MSKRKTSMTLRPFSIEALRLDMGWGYIATWQHLVEACMIKHRGADAPMAITVGAKRFAGWLVAQRDVFAGESDWGGDTLLCDGPLVERLLAATVLPDDATATRIAEMTEGGVLAEMWTRAAMDEGAVALAEASPPSDIRRGFKEIPWGKIGIKEEPEQPPRIEIAPGIDARYTHGTLGSDLPSGPIFHIVVDVRHGGHFVVTGMGVAFRLDLAGAQSLRSGLDEAIAHFLAERKAA